MEKKKTNAGESLILDQSKVEEGGLKKKKRTNERMKDGKSVNEVTKEITSARETQN